MNLLTLWQENDETLGTKVRYLDWNYKIKFLEINKYDKHKNVFFGKLDTGEDMVISGKTGPWKNYEEEDEYTAKAI